MPTNCSTAWRPLLPTAADARNRSIRASKTYSFTSWAQQTGIRETSDEALQPLFLCSLVEHRAQGVHTAKARPPHLRDDSWEYPSCRWRCSAMPSIPTLSISIPPSSAPMTPTSREASSRQCRTRRISKLSSTLPNEAAGREALARGQLLFVVNIPAGFTRQTSAA